MGWYRFFLETTGAVQFLHVPFFYNVPGFEFGLEMFRAFVFYFGLSLLVDLFIRDRYIYHEGSLSVCAERKIRRRLF
jgi:hypothetical protein